MRHTIPRTATVAWSPATYAAAGVDDPAFVLPLLATGTASGALDADFSAEAKLEIWSPFGEGGLACKGTVTVNSRFNRLIWGGVSDSRPRGVIAAGMENGELDLWDPVKLLEGKPAEECLINKMANHTGPIRGLDFNPLKTNLLASGASKGEVFIWDLNNPSKPFAPPPSRSLDDVTSVSWNRVVPSVLAASSTNGYTVVWDIREANGQKGREVSALSYSGPAQMGYPGQAMGPQYGGQWVGAPGGRAGGVSAVVWHPENPTKLATASEDDGSPIIMVWDLRNARAPERVLQGHDKGVLNLAWCQRDSDLLMSCGKDCRTICWNPQTGALVAEVAPGSNWAFQTEWCPRNPDLVATASFDGRIAIDSLQSTRDQPEMSPTRVGNPAADGSDIFGDQGLLALNNARAAVSLKQAPKWLKTPVVACFGFGGKLVTVSHRAVAQAPTQPGEPVPAPIMVPSVKIRQPVTEPKLVERALKLEHAVAENSLSRLCDQRVAGDVCPANATTWRLLGALFRADSRDELVTLLGFSKEEVRSKVEAQIAAFRDGRPTGMSRTASEAGTVPNTAPLPPSPKSEAESMPREPLVTFADAPVEGLSSSSDGGEAALRDVSSSEASISAVSESTKVIEAESEVTVPSLFGDEGHGQANPQQASADFFNSIRNGRPSALPDHVFGRSNHPASSVGATAGSRGSSVASEVLRNNTFKIYPADESKGERLITRALVLGDFDSAVSLCLSVDRFADALLLAVRGGPELLAKTQKAYFERQTAELPYLRLYQSIVLDDLADVVQNADLSEWQEIFGVLCTFAKSDEFSGLAEQLGQRLEFQYVSHLDQPGASEHRKNAILCYLAAGKLEKVVGIWIDQMREEEQLKLQHTEGSDARSRYSVRAGVLQTFIEKVTIFQSAVNYVDADLAQPTTPSEAAATGDRAYKLASLYDCYSEYAEFLAAQGLVTSALRYVAKTPAGYPTTDLDFSQTRMRLTPTTGTKSKTAAPAARQRTPVAAPAAGGYTYAPSVPTSGPVQYGTTSNYNSSGAYTPSAGQSYVPAQAQPFGAQGNFDSPYSTPANLYGASALNQYAHNQATSTYTPAPPPPIGTSAASSPVPAPPKRDAGGWNDAPTVSATRKAAGSATGHRAAITSPFPNVPASPPPGQAYPGGTPYGGQPSPNVPPPPRGGSRTPAQVVPPPPRAGQRPSVPPSGAPPYGVRPGSVGSYGPRSGSVGHSQASRPGMPPPPGQPQPVRYGSPQNQSVPSQYVPSQAQGPYGPGPNQGPYAPAGMQRGPPPPNQVQQPYGAVQTGGRHMPGPAGGFAPAPGGPARRPSSPAAAPAPAKAELPKTKYPPGDRTHIPLGSRPIFESLSRHLGQMRQAVPPTQKKLAEDTERRLNALFDGLNCETIPTAVIDELLGITAAMDARNPQQALQLHLSLLTSGIKFDNLTTFMPAIKMLISHMR